MLKRAFILAAIAAFSIVTIQATEAEVKATETQQVAPVKPVQSDVNEEQKLTSTESSDVIEEEVNKLAACPCQHKKHKGHSSSSSSSSSSAQSSELVCGKCKGHVVA